MTAPPEPLVIHGWRVMAHPLFLDPLQALVAEVERLKARDPTKRLAAIRKLAFDIIPEDPGRPEYRQGAALGADHRHWFRAKFFQQYRLFFRFHAASRLIVLAWVNDERTLRAYESGTDAYRVFRRMLEAGHPPDDWDALVAEAGRQGERLSGLR
jgi:toxin YhaV